MAQDGQEEQHGERASSVEDLVRAACAAISPRQHHHHGRFLLFHSGFSVCSEKVRATLAEAGEAYTSYAVDLSTQQNYHPAYVALRVRAWAELPTPPPPLVGELWTASNASSAAGFDPAVVPTLVDLATAKIVVDSLAICRYVVANATTNLCPEAHRELIDKHLRLVDETPHTALIYDGNVERPERRAVARGLHAAQIPALEERLAERGTTWDDDLLERAYRAKLARMRAGAAATRECDEASNPTAYQLDIVARVKAVLRALEADLRASATGWVCGTPSPTLADLFHGISLYRLVFLGCEYMWTDLPHVTAFADKVFALKSIQDAVIFFPGRPENDDTRRVRRRISKPDAAEV